MTTKNEGNFELKDDFVPEDDFSYFCMYDDCFWELCCGRPRRGIELPAIADSCYVDVKDVFPPWI